MDGGIGRVIVQKLAGALTDAFNKIPRPPIQLCL